MSPTLTQIVSFVTKNDANFQELAEVVKIGTNGIQSQALGKGEEEPDTKHWFLGTFVLANHAQQTLNGKKSDWDEDTKLGIPDFEKILHPLTSEPIRNVHVWFRESPGACVRANVTEFIVATAKPGQDLVAFDDICNMTLRTTAEQPGCTGTTWGAMKENARDFILLVGWNSIEVSPASIC